MCVWWLWEKHIRMDQYICHGFFFVVGASTFIPIRIYLKGGNIFHLCQQLNEGLSTLFSRFSSKEGNVLFNDALNTFYIWLYGVVHMVLDYSESERGNLLPPLYRLLFLISSKGSFICTMPEVAHTVAFVILVVEHWLEREVAHWMVNPTTHRIIYPYQGRIKFLGYV